MIHIPDYLRETEDILSYEPFLGVAGPPGEASHAPGPAQYHAPQPEQAGEAAATEPMFSGPIPNVTVNVGREAVLECRVDNLRGYKVTSSRQACLYEDPLHPT